MGRRRTKREDHPDEQSNAFAIGSLIALAILTGGLVLIAVFLY
jgi:hypothetical protein